MSDSSGMQSPRGATTWSDGETETALAPFPAPANHDWQADSNDDRRRHPRRPLELGVEMYGYDSALSLVHSYGTTVNVSAGGLYAHVDLPLPVGSRTVIAVRSERRTPTPRILRGRVVRCEERDTGAGIAVAFSADDQVF